ncbi:hypothetical protein DICVIV_03654 [Dictyocaulus viviparus]|uniref:G-protein coupled receptors family 1 profile domain-containing protein n=1 Tax=Dictyocaulus viviparus TaxID=29172 RepID=A0A0D8Y0L0_DICVI|nr:hypothetical protein DICVIV_03654 [Dictyocaulus viviparus]
MNKPLRITVLLSLTDLLHAIAASPYIVYLITKWNRNHIDMDPYVVIIASIPSVINLKINLMLTVAVALDRALALYAPIRYRKISSLIFANVAFLFGFALGVCDLILIFTFTKFKRVPDCGALGCFVSLSFRTYWGVTNMALSLVVIILTIFVMVKLQCIRFNSNLSQSSDGRRNKFTKANCSSLIYLLCSIFFFTTPSVLVGGTELFGNGIFRFIGPLNLFGMMAAGCSNGIVFIVWNNEIQVLMKRLICGMRPLVPPNIINVSQRNAQTTVI